MMRKEYREGSLCKGGDHCISYILSDVTKCLCLMPVLMCLVHCVTVWFTVSIITICEPVLMIQNI